MQPTGENVRTLYQAAAAGDVVTLFMLLDQDSRVLDKSIAQGCCTPLHIAAKLGQLEFAKALLERKPAFLAIQDFEGSTPLHIAVVNGHVEVVKAFLEVDPEICFAKDFRGRNPLHASVIRGGFELLQPLVEAKPEAALAPADEGQTILHLCVRNSNTKTLCLLVESVEGMNTSNFMNTKDGDGFTALHLAVAENQTEIVRYLIEKTAIDINLPTAKGYTALDIVESQRRRNTIGVDIVDILLYNGAVSSKVCSAISHVHQDQVDALIELGKNGKRKKTKKTKANMEWVEKKRNTLMVVASLIATMAYQAGTNPPVSVWQQTKDFSGGSFFLVFNTAGFLASLFVILLLISGLPFKHKAFMWILILVMWAAVSSMALAYGVSVRILGSIDDLQMMWLFFAVVSFFWILLLCLLVVGHIIRLIWKGVSYIKKKKASSSAQSKDQNAIV